MFSPLWVFTDSTVGALPPFALALWLLTLCRGLYDPPACTCSRCTSARYGSKSSGPCHVPSRSWPAADQMHRSVCVQPSCAGRRAAWGARHSTNPNKPSRTWPLCFCCLCRCHRRRLRVQPEFLHRDRSCSVYLWVYWLAWPDQALWRKFVNTGCSCKCLCAHTHVASRQRRPGSSCAHREYQQYPSIVCGTKSNQRGSVGVHSWPFLDV